MRTNEKAIGRRGFLAGLTALGGYGTLTRLGLGGGLALPAIAVRAQTDVPDTGTWLLLLGTQGGPNVNAERRECASVVVVDGRGYLVDCGYGALGRLKDSGLGFRGIANVFLTHLHDDHTADLPALLSHQWTDGRTDPTQVVGPYGTQSMVEAALAFSAANAAIRLVDEGRSIEPADIFSGRDIQAASTPIEIFSDDRVTVSSIENAHFPESTKAEIPYRSVAYRFDSRDRSVTISGDTAYSKNVVRLAEGSDVFLCETIQVPLTKENFDKRVAAGAYADNPEGIWKHIIGTHSSTEDAGRMAAEAGVGKLVLTHLVPGAQMDVGDEVYLEGVRKHFDGDVVVGKDLMVV